MKNLIKALKYSIALLLTISSFIACDRDFTVIESDVLGDGNANFNTIQSTLPIVAYQQKLEAVQVNGLASYLLGFFNDPAFGSTTASIVAQLTPATLSPSFGTNPEIDSIVISMPYFSSVTGFDEDGSTTYQLDSVYGNANATIKLSIYQNNYFLRNFNPNGDLYTSQKYYSNSVSGSNSVVTESSTINFDDHVGELIYSTNSFLPSPAASVEVVRTDTDTTTTIGTPKFRATLTSEEAKTFWKNTIIDKEGDAVLNSANNFKDYFRGVYLKAEPINNNGHMILLNLASTDANITIHYTYGEEDARYQSSYVLNFTSNILNTFLNNYNIPLENGNTTDGDQNLYLKGQAGSMAVVDLFPDSNSLEDFRNEFTDADGNPTKLINEAHLEIYEDTDKAINGSYGDAYHKYDRIYAFDIKNNVPLIDYSYDQTDNTTTPIYSKIISLGQRDSISPTEAKYKIRITEHLKNILFRDSTNTKIGLVISNNVNYTSNAEILNPIGEVNNVPAATLTSPRGTVLHGNQSADENKKLKLKIFYTEPK